MIRTMVMAAAIALPSASFGVTAFETAHEDFDFDFGVTARDCACATYHDTAGYRWTSSKTGAMNWISGRFDTADAGASFADIRMKLYAGSDAAPLQLLATSAVTRTSGKADSFRFGGWGGFQIEAGMTYWLVAEALEGGALWHGYENTGAESYLFRNGVMDDRPLRDSLPSTTIDVTPVPLPAGGLLILSGLAGLAAMRVSKRLTSRAAARDS